MATVLSLARRFQQLSWSKLPHRSFGTTKKCTKYTNMDEREPVVVEKRPGITMVGINRPEVRNCVNTPTAEALLQAFRDFNNDSEAKVAVLYGVGGNFCAGFDLKELAHEPPTFLAEFGRGSMGPTRYESEKPVIAAVEGSSGLELALWCDLRVVEENAILGVFCRRFGVPLIDGGTVRLPAILGLGRALDLILTGRPIKAKEAFELGLVTQIVSAGTAVEGAYNLAQSLTKFPQEGMLADRRSTLNAAFSSTTLQDALKFEHENSFPVAMELLKGVQRFKEGIGRHRNLDFNPNKSNKSKL